jgi:hypothetical protein
LISVGSVVQVYSGPGNDGAIAQLGEHLLCKQGVVGSIPTGSRKKKARRKIFKEKDIFLLSLR